MTTKNLEGSHRCDVCPGFAVHVTKHIYFDGKSYSWKRHCRNPSTSVKSGVQFSRASPTFILIHHYPGGQPLEVYMVKHYKKTLVVSNRFLSSWKRSLELWEDTGTPKIFSLSFGFHDFHFIKGRVLATRPCDSGESLKAKGFLNTNGQSLRLNELVHFPNN